MNVRRFSTVSCVTVANSVADFRNGLRYSVGHTEGMGRKRCSPTSCLPIDSGSIRIVCGRLVNFVNSMGGRCLSRLLRDFFSGGRFRHHFGFRSTTGDIRRNFMKNLLRRALNIAGGYSCFTGVCPILGHSLLLATTVFRSVKGLGRLSAFPRGSCASTNRLLKRVVVNTR